MPALRTWFAAPVVCGFCTIAFGAACDAGQRRREPIGTLNPAPVRSAAPAKPATVPARVAAIGDEAAWSAARATWIRNSVRAVQ